MKELSIEEKAKRYDEAIERAKECHTDGLSLHQPVKDVLEHIFPELTESEDERIRKELIGFLRNIPNSNYTCEEMAAWLEKQGEQKPKFRVGDTIKCKYDDRQFTIKSVDLDKGTYTYTQEGCGNDIDYADEKFELVEQKPVWSEEDENRFRNLIYLVEHSNEGKGTKEGFIKFINRLKSLKDRVQQKQEWSEEDEEMLNSIVARLHSHPNVDLEEYSKEYNWLNYTLKSLRPWNHWKPSEEQMKALWDSIPENVKEISEREMLLDSLYQDLKKLKVE